jgi:hypothetical protein
MVASLSLVAEQNHDADTCGVCDGHAVAHADADMILLSSRWPGCSVLLVMSNWLIRSHLSRNQNRDW